MPRLRALNESSSDESEEETEEKETIEAQEDRAFSLYKKALELRQRGEYVDAEELLISILSDDFLENVSPEDFSDGHPRPAAALKYACLKNLGNVLILQSRAEDGLKCFIQAVELDNSDVTMWYQMGKVAMQIDDFHLASHAFQEGLRCNARHWPCLDSLLPLLYALNDYLGCLLLVSRTLELDAEYPQALAVQNLIAKEDKNLIQNFKFFFPEEKDIAEVCCDISEEELSGHISHAVSLQAQYISKTSAQSSDDTPCANISINLQSNTWEDLGKNLLQMYKSISSSQGKSFLQFVNIKASNIEPGDKQTTTDNDVENTVAPSGLPDIESEAMDVDSEQEVKGDDQTEEDATEASGLEQDEEAKMTVTVQQNSAALKQKRKKSSSTLMDQWSKRRSGRRAGRKAEEREESNLASRFRSLLPDSLWPKDLEAELAKASRRRSLRDPIDAWGDDSMDTIELCRLLDERDAKDDQKRRMGLHAKDIVPQRILQENYFGTEKEVAEVLSFVEEPRSETYNIIQLVVKFIGGLADKYMLTWPPGLVPIYVELYECMRKHISYQTPFDSALCSSISIKDLLESLIYCELYVDIWHQKNMNDAENIRENGFTFSEALGNVTLLSGLNHLFTSPLEQCKISLRINWMKVHLFLLQEDSASAIYSLQNVLDSLDVAEMVGTTQSVSNVSHCVSKVVTSDEVISKSSEGDQKIQQSSNEIILKSSEGQNEIQESSKEKCDKEENINESVVGDTVIEDQKSPHVLNQSVDSVAVAKDNGESGGKLCDFTNCDASAVKDEPIVEELMTTEPSTEINENVTPTAKLEELNGVGENTSLISSPVEEEKIDQMEAETAKEMLPDACQETDVEIDGTGGVVQSSNDKEEPALEKSDQVVDKVKQIDTLDEANKMQENVSDLSVSNQIELNSSLPMKIDESVILPKSIGESEQSGSSSIPITKTKPFSVLLPNCSVNQEISKRTTQKLHTSLTRQQQLSEIDDLYQSGQYELLAGTLTECFKFCAQQIDNDNSEIDNLPDRVTQMAMLLDSLWQLKKYPDCFYWGEACLHEAFNRYLNSTEGDNGSQDQDDHKMWATAIERLLGGLNDCLKVAGLKLMEKLPKNCLTRLVQTLTTILCQQLEQSDTSVELAIECTTPWVILHRIVFFEEQQHPIEQDCVPSHMSILFTAHEYMSKKGRCCLNEGILLNLILDVVVAQLQSEELKGVRNQLNQEVDQAILCLYGHPKKPIERSRKRILDHRVLQQIELTWERSLALLRFYEPDELPTYDSISKISPEEEQLFLKIAQLVPKENNPNRFLEEMKAFLKGATDTLPEVQCSIPEAASNLYYLLANYYMKTFKWEPAIKYYMLDVCLNPYRFDSWAGMALARAASLTSDLNSCDTLDNELQLHHKTKAQRCFQKAVELDPENTTMWIEFGSFAYTVHSFCSRLLKTETDSLSMEMFTKIEEEKDKMLSLTEQCFKTVEKLDQEEPWLPQYMLGKVAEKRGEPPSVFLQHYRTAAKLLFDSNAVYPLSLNYDPPQHYAFEAHEVHYRIHASILKHLEIMEGKYLSEEVESLFREILDEAAAGPFMAARGMTHQTLAKRQSVDPAENIGKRMKFDESVATNLIAERDSQLTKVDVRDVAGSGSSLQSNSNVEVLNSGQDINTNKSENSLVASIGLPSHTDLSKKCDPTSNLPEKMDPDCEIISGITSGTNAIEGKPDTSTVKETESESCQTSQASVGETKNTENTSITKDEMTSPGTTSRLSPSSLASNSEIIIKDIVMGKSSPQDSSKENRDAISFTKPVVDVTPPNPRNLDHTDMVNQCLVAMEECLARYSRHYKSFYRLCHYYFRSKQHRNLRKCRQLLLGDNRLPQSSKNITGLFKSNGVHSMFNDVWRIPIEEIDRAGSFASHMSRCVHLLMELLRALRDHGFLLKLSVFLKRDPEKKDKKYLRDNERADLSKQALVLCLAAMRECVNEARTVDHVIELYRTVKEGIKELPLKESAFKGLLSDAYRKVKGMSRDQGEQQSFYEAAVDFCLKELNIKQKAIADAKAKALGQVYPQVQAQAQVQSQVQDQLQAQALAQAMQMGVNVMSSALPFNALSQRFPTVGNTSLGNPLADATANAMANAMVNSMASSMASSMANSMFLPQMPLYRGRGRPPKAQQRLHNAMMNMAHMMGLANVPQTGQNLMDSSKTKPMKQQQKQRRSQQVSGAQTNVVSSIIKDRPALSITALQGNKTTGQSTASVPTPPSASSLPTAPMRTGSPYSSTGMNIADVVPTNQTGWQRPRLSGPRPMPGATDPRSMLNPSMGRKEGPRFKGPSTSSGAFPPKPSGPFAPQPQANAQLDSPAALLSRLPGLQIKQRAHPTMPHPQQSQPAEKLQKTQMANLLASKPAVSISKISTPPSHSPQGSSAADSSQPKKKGDPNFDIITLD